MVCVNPLKRACLVGLLVLSWMTCVVLFSFSHAVAQPPAGEPTAEEQKEKLAADKFLEVLIKKPAMGTALDRVFGFHVERGSIAALIEQLKQKADRSSNLDETGRHYLLIGLLQLQRSEDAQAVQALAEAESLLKANSQAAYHYGQALLLVGDTDGAAAAFERAIARKPARTEYLSIARELGRLYQRSGKADDALRIWNDLEKTFPGDDSVQARIATTLMEEGDLPGALRRYELLAKSARTENDRLSFALDAARLRSQLGQKEQALQQFNATIAKLRPGSYLYDEARRRIEAIFLSSGDYAGLTAYYESWLKDHPDDLNATVRMARNLSLQGRTSEAIERFEQAIERAPTDEGLRLAAIDVAMADNRYADAARHFEALTQANPRNPDYLVRYGQVLLGNVQRPEAERAEAAAAVWKRLTDARPKEAAVHSQVADLLRSAKLSDQAIASYRMAIQLAPDDPQHKEYLGEYLHQLKRTEEAMTVWRSLAEGSARNLDNLVRLAEVFHQFDHPTEALEVMAEACTMKPKINHRLRYVEWLIEASQFDKANAQLELAQAEADSVEDRALTFATALKTYKAAGQLAERIEQATAAVKAAPQDGQQLRQLAMLYEASNNAGEALRAINQAVAAQPNSIETLDAAARLTENSGDIARAIELRKRLVDSDRRFRSAHLQRLAALYVQVDQTDLALATGKELLASAGGALDAFRFYADLCGQLGRSDERLDTLRRCLRLNPRSVEAHAMLVNQLAEDFKTDQAIELAWRQFDLTEDLENRRGLVSQLADLYLRGNRLDQLISRLESRGRETNDRRTAIDLMATAYQQAGDLGLARDTLEGLLRESGRDTLLMERLVSLLQQAGDVDRAIELQRELVRIAPGKPTQSRLASMLIDVGAFEDAQTLWLSSMDIRQDTSAVLQAIDKLVTGREYKAAFDLSTKALEALPSDWEMLSRRMILASLAGEWKLAEKDARTLLGLTLSEDEPSAASKQRGVNSQSGLIRWRDSFPKELQRLYGATQVWRMLDTSFNYPTNSLPVLVDFGTAKSYARLVVMVCSNQREEADSLLARLKEVATAQEATQSDIWDWYAAEFLLATIRETPFEDYHEPASWESLWCLIDSGSSSGLARLADQLSTRLRVAGNQPGAIKPLSDERLQWLKVQSQKAADGPKSNRGNSWSSLLASELTIAGKDAEAQHVLTERLRRASDSADAYETVRVAAMLAKDDELWRAIQDAIASEQSKPMLNGPAYSTRELLLAFTHPDRVARKQSLGATDANYRLRVMSLIDRMIEQAATDSTKRALVGLSTIGGPRNTYIVVGNNYQSVTIEFPPAGLAPTMSLCVVCTCPVNNSEAMWTIGSCTFPEATIQRHLRSKLGV